MLDKYPFIKEIKSLVNEITSYPLNYLQSYEVRKLLNLDKAYSYQELNQLMN